jgi:hypothetical protein
VVLTKPTDLIFLGFALSSERWVGFDSAAAEPQPQTVLQAKHCRRFRRTELNQGRTQTLFQEPKGLSGPNWCPATISYISLTSIPQPATVPMGHWNARR